MLDGFLSTVLDWACTQPHIDAVALIGSHARGAARADSDVDLIMLTSNRDHYLDDVTWTQTFGRVLTTARESYGSVESLRVHYAGGLEVEFALAAPNWADVDPPDSGTLEVVRGGFIVLADKSGRLPALQRLLRITQSNTEVGESSCG